MDQRIKFTGGCHCKYVRFEVRAPRNPQVVECNCSICSMTGYQHLIVPGKHFKLLCGNEFIQTYTFNTGVAKHYFCKNCGIKSFYIPRSDPDGYSVNVRCLDEPEKFGAFRISHFDGEHWEQSIDALRNGTDAR